MKAYAAGIVPCAPDHGEARRKDLGGVGGGRVCELRIHDTEKDRDGIALLGIEGIRLSEAVGSQGISK